MDWTVYPNSRISSLPRPLRPPALLARNIATLRRPRYVYEADGLATVHYTPFLDDEEEFSDLHWQMAAIPGLDYRWRTWILTRMARHASRLPGNFTEFGTYRGGCAALILATTGLSPGRRFFLFDTFSGVPERDLTHRERGHHLGGRYADTSRAQVESRLSEWSEVIEIREGNVFDTLPNTETGDLSFVHMDLNASAPTKIALEYAYPRLVEGGVVVLDDYGWRAHQQQLIGEFEDQRQVIDEFLDGRPEDVIALPTGQGLIIRAPEG